LLVLAPRAACRNEDPCVFKLGANESASGMSPLEAVTSGVNYAILMLRYCRLRSLIDALSVTPRNFAPAGF
jgi:hypothetical protein